MKVHLFGAVSFPSCCNYVLRKTTNNNESDYPIAAETIFDGTSTWMIVYDQIKPKKPPQS